MPPEMSDSNPKPSPPQKKVLSAGKEVDAWCTRCRMDLGHRIVAMVGNTPKRVVCMTCDSEHNYRAPKGEETPKPVRPKVGVKPKATSKNTARATWENEIRSGKPIRPYSISATFSEGQLIDHKKFGLGHVVQIASPEKIIVAFESGERTLIHGSK